MLDEALDSARDGAAQARSAALGMAADVTNSVTYREADLRARDALHSAQNGAAVDAVRAYWMAAALFSRVQSETQLASTPPSSTPPSSTPGAAPVVGTRSADESRGAIVPPSGAAADSPRPASRGTEPAAGVRDPLVSSRPLPPSDEPAIRAALRAYAAAYSDLDAGAVQAVFPSVNLQALRRAFGGLRLQRVEIQDEQLTLNGQTATVSCTLVTLAIGQVGAATPQRDSRRVTFTLARRDGTWVIVDRR
jgi:hypothetical protein